MVSGAVARAGLMGGWVDEFWLAQGGAIIPVSMGLAECVIFFVSCGGPPLAWLSVRYFCL